MISDNKSKILRGVFEDNLHHVVRDERRTTADDLSVLEYRRIGIATVLYSIAVSIIIISLSDNGNVSLANSATISSSTEMDATRMENPSDVASATNHLSRHLATMAPAVNFPSKTKSS